MLREIGLPMRESAEPKYRYENDYNFSLEAKLNCSDDFIWKKLMYEPLDTFKLYHSSALKEIQFLSLIGETERAEKLTKQLRKDYAKEVIKVKKGDTVTVSIYTMSDYPYYFCNYARQDLWFRIEKDGQELLRHDIEKGCFKPYFDKETIEKIEQGIKDIKKKLNKDIAKAEKQLLKLDPSERVVVEDCCYTHVISADKELKRLRENYYEV